MKKDIKRHIRQRPEDGDVRAEQRLQKHKQGKDNKEKTIHKIGPAGILVLPSQMSAAGCCAAP